MKIKTGNALLSFSKNSQKEERNSFKVYPDFNKEEGQIQCKLCTHMWMSFWLRWHECIRGLGWKKHSSVVPTFEDLKKSVVENKTKLLPQEEFCLRKLGSYHRLFALIVTTIKKK